VEIGNRIVVFIEEIWRKQEQKWPTAPASILTELASLALKKVQSLEAQIEIMRPVKRRV